MPGAKIEDVEVNLGDLLHKDLEIVLLHVGTNNAVSDSPEDMLSKLISLVDSINRSLTKCNVFINNLINRTDNQKTNGEHEKVNTLLKGSNYRVLDKNNNKEKQLGKHSLHLNAQGNAILASNFLNAIRNQEWRSLDSYYSS